MSNEPGRPGRSSLGTEVAVIDNLDEEDDEEEDDSGHDSKVAATAAGSTF